MNKILNRNSDLSSQFGTTEQDDMALSSNVMKEQSFDDFSPIPVQRLPKDAVPPFPSTSDARKRVLKALEQRTPGPSSFQ